MSDDALPFGDETDRAVVGYVDGDLEAFAGDHDLTVEAVRDRLEAWPGLAPRMATVLAARRSTRARALDQRRTRAIAAAVVAVVAVAAGIAFAVTRPEPTRRRGAHHSMGSHVMDAYIGGIGEIGDPRNLSAAIARRGPVDVGLGSGSTPTTVLGGSGLPIAAERCVRVAMPGRTVSLVATGEFRGLGAAIWVTRAGGADVAFVSALDSCDILYSQRLGGTPAP